MAEFETDVQDYLRQVFFSDDVGCKAVIQELWSGYGSLERWMVDGESVVVKLIQHQKAQKHPRGWSSDIGHERKVKSYEVERHFYRNYSGKYDHLNIPRLLHFTEQEKYSILVLEDLKNQRAEPVSQPNEQQIQNTLQWLAIFHAQFLNNRAEGLWQQGSYWHLNTRREEFERIEDKALKENAISLDARLQTARFQTIIHGDAKLANFLYNEKEAFAVDFQYVGKGAGIIDVMYFFSSCLNDEELYEHAERYLDNYFTYLKAQIGNHKEAKKIEEEWRGLYPIAWADFLRFLEGWSPGHWKLGSYASKQKQIALDLIRHED